jgi:hypothetical protein
MMVLMQLISQTTSDTNYYQQQHRLISMNWVQHWKIKVKNNQKM